MCCSESLCLAMQPEPADGYGMMIKSLGVPLFILRRRWWHQAVNPGPLCAWQSRHCLCCSAREGPARHSSSQACAFQIFLAKCCSFCGVKKEMT